MTGFYVLTRTWKTGYRFTPEDHSAEEKFYSLLKTAGIFATEEPFAVLYDGCLIAGGMETGYRDKEGRAIRFSLMLETGDTGKCFAHLAGDWDNAEEFMRSCINWEEYSREEIVFAAQDFVKWLEDYPESFRAHAVKWDKSGISELEYKSSSLWPKVCAVVAVIAAVVAVSVFLWLERLEPKVIAHEQEEVIMSQDIEPDSTELAYREIRRAIEKLNEAKQILDRLAGSLDIDSRDYSKEGY